MTENVNNNNPNPSHQSIEGANYVRTRSKIKLFLNGEEKPIPPDGNVTFSVVHDLHKSNQQYIDQTLKFNVYDVIKGISTPMGVNYDAREGVITCTLYLKKKEEYINVVVDTEQRVNFDDIGITIAGKNFKLCGPTTRIRLTGDEVLRKDECTVFYSSWQPENLHPSLQNINGELTYLIKLKRIPPNTLQQPLDPYGKKVTSTPYIQLNLDKAFLKEWLLDNPKSDVESLRSLRVKVTCNTGSMSTRSILQGDKKDKYYRIELPQDWRSSTISVELLDEHRKYNNAFSGKSYNLGTFEKIPKKKRPKLFVWYVACILLIFIIGYYLGKVQGSPTKENTEETVPLGHSKFDRAVETNKYLHYQQRMVAEDLSFDEVKEIDIWIKSLTPEQKSQIGVNDIFANQVQIYNEVVEMIINNPDAQALRGVLKEERSIGGEEKKISDIMVFHLCYLRAAYMGLYLDQQNPDNGKRYTKEGKNKAMLLYNEYHATFTSFRDIYSRIEPYTKMLIEKNKTTNKSKSSKDIVLTPPRSSSSYMHNLSLKY